MKIITRTQEEFEKQRENSICPHCGGKGQVNELMVLEEYECPECHTKWKVVEGEE